VVSHELLTRLRHLCARKRTPVIAIGGFGGSGKSTLADELRDELGASVVRSEDFYVPDLGYADLERLRSQVLEPLSQSKPARYQRFDWQEERLMEWRDVSADGTVIVEGVMVISRQLLDYYDCRIWIDCPQDVAFQRGLARDRTEYGAETLTQWTDVWMPSEREYVEQQRPMEIADFVIRA
jgi:uridine kinase